MSVLDEALAGAEVGVDHRDIDKSKLGPTCGCGRAAFNVPCKSEL